MNDAERLDQLINHLRLNPKQFAESLGFDRAERIYLVLRGKVKISKRLAAEIANKYKHTSYAWLLSGEGKMLNEYNTTEKVNIVSEPPPQNKDDLLAEKIKLLEDKIKLCMGTIESQRETIESQRETIDILKQENDRLKNPNGDGQKRKAG